jgi:hypothetical protein
VLEPVRDYKARHASTLLTFDAVVDAIGQIEGKRRPGRRLSMNLNVLKCAGLIVGRSDRCGPRRRAAGIGPGQQMRRRGGIDPPRRRPVAAPRSRAAGRPANRLHHARKPICCSRGGWPPTWRIVRARRTPATRNAWQRTGSQYAAQFSERRCKPAIRGFRE